MTLKPTLEQLECRLTPANVAPPPWLVEAEQVLWQGGQPTIDWSPEPLDDATAAARSAAVQDLSSLEVKEQAAAADGLKAIDVGLMIGRTVWAGQAHARLDVMISAVHDYVSSHKDIAQAKADAYAQMLALDQAGIQHFTAAEWLSSKDAVLKAAARLSAGQKIEHMIEDVQKIEDVDAFIDAVRGLVGAINEHAQALYDQSAFNVLAMFQAVGDADPIHADQYYLDAGEAVAAGHVFDSFQDRLYDDLNSLGMPP
jgi:hypothetical protein